MPLPRVLGGFLGYLDLARLRHFAMCSDGESGITVLCPGRHHSQCA